MSEGTVARFDKLFGNAPSEDTSAEATAEASPETEVSEVPDGDQADN